MAKRRAKGEGTIWHSKTDGRWKAQITLFNGTRRGKTGKTQKEVKDWLLEQRRKLSTGLIVADDQIRLGDFLDRYLAAASHKLRSTTLRAHSNMVRIHIIPSLGNIRLVDLQPYHIQEFYTQKLEEGLSRRSVQYIHAILHKALNQALRWELVNRNVTDLVDAPRPKRKTFRTWTADEVKRFLAAVEGHQWYPIYVIAAYTGLRQGEVLGLHKEDVDLKSGVIQVRHQITYVLGDGLHITEPKTEASRRPVTLPETALNVLKTYLKDFKGDKLIFTTRSGRPISPRNIVRHFKSVIAAEGLPEIRFHDLRHTHATLLLAAGVHPKIVQERLGHSSITLTLDTYSHVIPSLQTEAADQFEEILA